MRMPGMGAGAILVPILPSHLDFITLVPLPSTSPSSRRPSTLFCEMPSQVRRITDKTKAFFKRLAGTRQPPSTQEDSNNLTGSHEGASRGRLGAISKADNARLSPAFAGSTSTTATPPSTSVEDAHEAEGHPQPSTATGSPPLIVHSPEGLPVGQSFGSIVVPSTPPTASFLGASVDFHCGSETPGRGMSNSPPTRLPLSAARTQSQAPSLVPGDSPYSQSNYFPNASGFNIGQMNNVTNFGSFKTVFERESRASGLHKLADVRTKKSSIPIFRMGQPTTLQNATTPRSATLRQGVQSRKISSAG